jgi:hypothetical protein
MQGTDAPASRRRHRPLAAAVLLVVGACRARPPETRIVVVTATPPVQGAPVVLIAPTATPAVETAEFTFPVAQPTEVPTAANVAETESEPPPPEAPVRESFGDQLARCLSFRTERFGGETKMYNALLAVVRVANNCNESFPTQSVWIDVRVTHAGGGKVGLAGHQITRLYGNGPDGRLVTDIPAHGTTEVLVLIGGLDQSGLYRYETALSWKDDDGRPVYD